MNSSKKDSKENTETEVYTLHLTAHEKKLPVIQKLCAMIEADKERMLQVNRSLCGNIETGDKTQSILRNSISLANLQTLLNKLK